MEPLKKKYNSRSREQTKQQSINARIYKPTIRSLMTSIVETTSNTFKRKRIQKTTEIKKDNEEYHQKSLLERDRKNKMVVQRRTRSNKNGTITSAERPSIG